MIRSVFAISAAVLLLPLDGADCIEDHSYDRDRLVEEDVPPELCMLQKTAMAQKAEHEDLKHSVHTNSNSKGCFNASSNASTNTSSDGATYAALGLAHQHATKLHENEVESKPLEKFAAKANSTKSEHDGSKNQSVMPHSKLDTESKQQNSTSHGLSEGHGALSPKSKSRMYDQGPLEAAVTTLAPTSPPAAEGAAAPTSEGEAAPPAPEGEATPPAEAPAESEGRPAEEGAEPLEEAKSGEGREGREGERVKLRPEDDPRMQNFQEHFAEIALEIKEAKIVSCVLIAMISVFIVVHIMHEYDIHILPEGVMIIIVGICLGLVLKYWCDSRMMYDPEYRSEIAIQLLNEVFLPMLMLEAGWSVRRMDFISQLPYILNFAIIGTLISTCVIATLMYQTGQAGLHQIKTMRGCFVVASLISATDPVATLSTYSDLKVDPLLNIIVFGEAAINDAVAIVVFTLVNDDYYMESFDSPGSMIAFGTLKGAKTLSCSFLLGAGTCFVVCVLLRLVGMHRNKKLEILVVVLGGYLSYALGEYFRVSGIICTLFNGMFMGKYAKYHLSAEGSLLTSFYISQMSTIMDAGVFLLSGVCCICLSWEGRTLGLWLMVFCVIARMCSTVPCGLMCNFMKWTVNRNPNMNESDLHILTPKYLFMIWHAGLRGGIAENLALQIGEWLDKAEGEGAKESVRSAVFLLVGAYVIIFGGTTKMFLSFFGIPMGATNAEDSLSKTELLHVEGRLIDWLHNKVFFPLLVGHSTDSQNMDMVEGMGDNDVLEVLHEVCHAHRSGIMRKKEPELAPVSGGSRRLFLPSGKTRSASMPPRKK